MRRGKKSKFLNWQLTNYGVLLLAAVALTGLALGGLPYLIGGLAGVSVGSLLVWRGKLTQTFGASGLKVMGRADHALKKLEKVSEHPALRDDIQVKDALVKARTVREALLDGALELQKDALSGKYLPQDIKDRRKLFETEVRTLEEMPRTFQDLLDERQAYQSAKREASAAEKKRQELNAAAAAVTAQAKSEIQERKTERQSWLEAKAADLDATVTLPAVTTDTIGNGEPLR